MASGKVIGLENSSLAFMDALQQEQNTAFGENQAALGAVQNAWSPILAGGAIPEGYSPGLDKLLQSQIVSQGATSTANAENAAQLQEKQNAGGANVLPTGTSQAINSEIEATGRAATNKNLQAEKTADFQQGISNLEAGSQAELGVASGENETGLAGAATGAGGLGLDAAKFRFQQNQTTSPGAILGDIGQGIQDAAGIAGIASGFEGLGGGGSSGAPGGDQFATGEGYYD